MAAMGILMHKILRIIYGMLKNNKPFDLRIDVANSHHSVPAQKATPGKNPSRRFQPYDLKAPVSRRQKKKRLEQDGSHSVNDTKPGITEPVPVGDIIANMLPEI